MRISRELAEILLQIRRCTDAIFVRKSVPPAVRYCASVVNHAVSKCLQLHGWDVHVNPETFQTELHETKVSDEGRAKVWL